MQKTTWFKSLFSLFSLLLFAHLSEAQPLRTSVKNAASQVHANQQEVYVILDEILMRIRTEFLSPETPLSQKYKDLKGRYDKLIEAANQLSSTVSDFKSSCAELLVEWKREADELHDDKLKRISLDNLQTAKKAYEGYVQRLDDANKKLLPTEQSLKDHIIFIKHLLNAETIEHLDPTVEDLEEKVSDLLKDMDSLLDETQEYIEGI